MAIDSKIDSDIAKAHAVLQDGKLGARLAVVGKHQWDDEVRACLHSVSPDLNLLSIDRAGNGLTMRIIWQHVSGSNVQETTITTGQWMK